MKCGVVWSIIAFSLLGCSTKKSSTVATEGRVSPTYNGPAEATFCASAISYADTVAISGTATYNRREAWGNAASGGLGAAATTGVSHPATNHPIRQAEVRVLDPSGAVVQCGATDDSGLFNVAVPRGATTYTIAVDSRANNSLLKVSVLNAPEQNLFYSLTTTTTASTSHSVGTLTATANGDLLGGAFNIMDQIYEANRYLQTQVGACSSQFAGCRDVNSSLPLSKVSAYWEKGYNPNNYFGSASGLSFYLPGYSRLFILGGNDGVTDTVDTDHFDNSVIIHEYGHFLEDTVGNSDSPGGSHNGNKVIDPRLAWSEGWGNFFQAAVRGDNHYIDTIGNDDGGSTDMAFYTNVETAVSGSDYPGYAGEGNYREFSVTRLLWDAIDTNNDTQFTYTDNVGNVIPGFPEIWAAFTSTVRGFRYSNYAFRNIGLLHLIQEYAVAHSNANAQDWSSIRGVERQDGDEARYGQYVSTSGCTAGTFVPTPSPGNHYYFATNSVGFTSDGGLLSGSNQFQNNLFYHIKAPSSGSHTITLRYQDADGVAQEADLDLYIYKDDYHFGTTADMVGNSRLDATGIVSGPEADEAATVSLTNGANYLINVNAYTGAGLGTQAYFNLYLDGSLLCPASLVP